MPNATASHLTTNLKVKGKKQPGHIYQSNAPQSGSILIFESYNATAVHFRKYLAAYILQQISALSLNTATAVQHYKVLPARILN